MVNTYVDYLFLHFLLSVLLSISFFSWMVNVLALYMWSLFFFFQGIHCFCHFGFQTKHRKPIEKNGKRNIQESNVDLDWRSRRWRKGSGGDGGRRVGWLVGW